jgi:hypothetical protein
LANSTPFHSNGQRAVQPLHQFEQRRRQVLFQALALALAQVGAGLEDQVAVGQRVEFEQALERDLGEGAAAAAQFEERRRLIPSCCSTGATLSAMQAGENRAELGRGDKIAAFAELARTGAVVARPGAYRASSMKRENGIAPSLAAIS